MNRVKAQGASLTRMRTRIGAFVLAIIVALSMAAMTPLSAYAAEGPITNKDGVTINKTATDLTTDDQTTVTLNVGGEQSKDKAAVLFLLDKSTSNDVRKAASQMLEELASKTDTDIAYNVVIFSGTASSTGWKDVQDGESYADIYTNFVNGNTTSGTNMDAGIEEATQQIASLPSSFSDADTYLVTLSDGITYVWSDDGKVKTVPVKQQSALESPNEGETSIQDSASSWDASYGTLVKAGVYSDNSLASIYGSFSNFLNQISTKIANTEEAGFVKDYQSKYAEPFLTTAIYNPEDTKSQMDKYACGPEIAVYQSATGYASLESQFDYSYAYAVPEDDSSSVWVNYPWGKELMEYCKSISTNADDDIVVSNKDPEAMFAPIKNQLLYSIQKGVVTDIIDGHFNLTSLDSFKLTVGGTEYKGTVNEEANTVSFDNGNYVVTYEPDGAEGEQFTWAINTPVVKGSDLTLSYDLKLVNKETAAGTYTVPTNESATLEYTSTEGGEGKEVFPVPTVTYTVEETPVTPVDPGDGDNTNTNNNTQTVNVNTGTDGKASLLPQTSDNTMPFVVGLIALVALAGGAGIVAWRKSH